MQDIEHQALKRVQEMYKSAQQNNTSIPVQAEKKAVKEKSEPRKTEPDRSIERASKPDSFIDLIMKDKERSLIILLIIILLNEKADSSLILSLMYLIL